MLRPASSPHDEPNRNFAQDDLGNGRVLAIGQHLRFRVPGVRIKDGDSEKNMLVRQKTSTARTLYFDANQ